MTRYQTKPKRVEAIQFTGENGAECGLFELEGSHNGALRTACTCAQCVVVPNAWVITDARGNRSWLHPDQFFSEYEAAPVEAPSSDDTMRSCTKESPTSRAQP